MATKTKEHWAADEAARTRLLDFGHQHGLDGKGIVDVLGVEKLSDYTGTEAEAVGVLAEWGKAQEPPDEPREITGTEPAPEPVTYDEPTLDVSEKDQKAFYEACTQLPETPVIAWTVFQDAAGYEWSYTIHAGLPASQAAIARQLTAVEIAAFHQDADRYGWTPLIDGRRIGNGVAKAPTLQLVPPAQTGGNGNQTQTFSPQFLEYAGKSDRGSLYWKCKGYPFTQYGVTIWEEALPSELKERAMSDLSQDLDLTGWIATYSLQPSKNDPTRMVPDKVVTLTKAA